MRTLLICHHDAPFDRDGLARWLASFSELTGILVLRETPERQRKRVKRELERVGWLRFLDVLAFRAYYRSHLAAADAAWERETLAGLARRFAPVPPTVPVLESPTANTPEAQAFIQQCAPNLVLARCKQLLAERIFTIPTHGTVVLHPGVCPEYRNAHGGFWALANDDVDKVGVSLLRIDKGIDTGPIYGYFGYRFDELQESHIVIQQRCVTENLDAIRERFSAIVDGSAASIDTRGRPSGEWGQPWLSRYLRWKRHARGRVRAGVVLGHSPRIDAQGALERGSAR